MGYVCCFLGSQRPGLGQARVGAKFTSLLRHGPFGSLDANQRSLNLTSGFHAERAERTTGRPSESAAREQITLADPKYQTIATFWDERKNGDLKLDDVSHKSMKPVHLRCNGCPTCGRQHEWTALPSNLTKRGGNVICPFCQGTGVKGRICFCRTIASDDKAMAEWSADNELQPELVARKSNKTVKWRCLRGVGHADYEARPQNRFSKGEGCPLCAGPRHGTVKAVRPDLVAEWHELNEKSPEVVTCGSDYKAQWKCQKCSHEWKATVRARANKGTGCPACARARHAQSKA